MSLLFLLDTSIISAPVAKQPNRRVAKQLAQHSMECALAAPVWHELVYGCSRLPPGKRRVALEEYLHAVVQRSFPILPYDEAAAAWHGRAGALEDVPGRSRRDGRGPRVAEGRGNRSTQPQGSGDSMPARAERTRPRRVLAEIVGGRRKFSAESWSQSGEGDHDGQTGSSRPLLCH